jgi:hypothetical protein
VWRRQRQADQLPSVSEPATSPATAKTASSTPPSAASTPTGITAEEATNAAERFVDAMNQVAQEGGGYERYDSTVHSSCEPCVRQGERLRSLTANGKRVVGGVVKVVDLRIDRLAGNTALIIVSLESASGHVVDPKGETVESLPATPLSDVVLTIARTPDGVRVVNILELGER